MARVRKTQQTMENLFFNTPEQKVLRLLLSEPTTTFIPRVISSKLKGVRGLGGAEGLSQVLTVLEDLGFVDFVDNKRAVRLRDEGPAIQILKIFSAICDLESLKNLLEPTSIKGFLFGSRSNGKARSDSDYDLFIVADQVEEVKNSVAHHPLGKSVEVVVWTLDDFEQIDKKDPGLKQKLIHGIQLWGSTSNNW